MDPLDAAIEMLIAGGAPTISFNMSDADVEAFMRQPWTMTSTDGGLPHFGKTSEHPRAYGAFPRKLRNYVLDKPVIPMAQAIRSEEHTSELQSLMRISYAVFCLKKKNKQKKKTNTK